MLQMSTLIQAASHGGLEVEIQCIKTWMTSHIGSMQDIVKLGIIMFLYWIVTKT